MPSDTDFPSSCFSESSKVRSLNRLSTSATVSSSSSEPSSSPNDTSLYSGRSSMLVSGDVSTVDCDTDISPSISKNFSSTCIPADSISSVSCE